MKYLLLLTTVFACLSFNKPSKCNYSFCPLFVDTSHIAHLLDGNTNEWPDTLFQADKETSMRYAVDNDAQHLFLALRIPDFRTQMKLMRQGMSLYVDLKGKKKEGKGIEFPMKPDQGESFSGGGQGNAGDRGSFNKKAFRESMALHLIGMKLFGFTNEEPSPQGLQMEGSANIGFIWDSADVMHIEYVIPFDMFGDVSSMNKKTISIGWKINAVETASANTVAFSNSSVQGRPSTNNATRNNSRGNTSNSFPPDMPRTTSELSVWTKYTIGF